VTAALLAIGDEIVGGITTDTNSGWLAEQLRAIGVEPVGGFAVADDPGAIRRALRRALDDADVVITTGGLGPTADDLTTECIASLTGRALRLDAGVLRAIRERFAGRGMEMPPSNRKQAMIPEGCTVIPNPDGTAPGAICPADGGRHIVSLPGVPREMRRMAAETVIPWLAERNRHQRFASRIFSTTGLAESRLGELLDGVATPAEARIAFRAAFPRMQTRLTVRGGPGEELEARLDALEVRVRERLGEHLYAVGDEGMEETVGRLLRERGLTLAVAESCTGGLIGHRLTEVPGSSLYFLLGTVTYSYESKREILGVRQETLDRCGAVSTETAEEMAAGVRRRANSELGLATTGIAGPGGGTPDKPAGTVCIALDWEGGAWSRRYDLGERGRAWTKAMTAQLALDRVRRHLLGEGRYD
jgi:nicotinamide-nucleotide amidase